MMTRARRWGIVLPLVIVACAKPPAPLASGDLREVLDQPLPPFEIHKDCVAMAPGDRLEYSFQTQKPVAFNIHYRDGKAMIMPVTREDVSHAEGSFEALTAHDYCLMWESLQNDTMLAYRVQLVRRKTGGASR